MLHNSVRVVIEFLEIVTEISHYMSAFENSFQKLIFIAKISHVRLFILTHVLCDTATNELILKAMNGPTNMCRNSSVILVVSWLGPPNELCFVLEKNVLVGSFNKITFNAQMSQYSKSTLWMAKWVSSHWDFRIIVELFFEKMQA